MKKNIIRKVEHALNEAVFALSEGTDSEREEVLDLVRNVLAEVRGWALQEQEE